MKTFSLALAVFLVTTASFCQAQAGTSSMCCVATASRPIPLALLASYSFTSTRCPFPAVIFLTKRGRLLCADPQTQWTQKLILLLNAN